MSEKFKIILLGKTVGNVSAEIAKKNLATVLKVDIKKAEQLISKTTVLKSDLKKSDAIRYQKALEKTGVLFKIEKYTNTELVSKESSVAQENAFCVHCGKIFDSKVLIEIERKNYCHNCIPYLFGKLREQIKELQSKVDSTSQSQPTLVNENNKNIDKDSIKSIKEETIHESILSFKIAYFSASVLPFFIIFITLSPIFIIMGFESIGFSFFIFIFFFIPISSLLAYLKSKNYHLRITNQRVVLTTGIISKSDEEIEYVRVKDISYTQGIIERMLKFGHVKIHSTDSTAPTLDLILSEPKKWREKIRDLVRKEKERRGVRYEERI